MSQAELDAFFKREYEKWGALVKLVGATGIA